jgi:hypothetical protein
MNGAQIRSAFLALALLTGLAAGQGKEPPAPPAGTAVPAVARQCGICHDRKDFKVVQPDGSVRPLYVDGKELHESVHAKWSCIDCHADINQIPHPKTLEKVNCQRCHFPGNPVGAPEDVNYEGYVQSVHGRLRHAGNTKAPLCQDCHGTHHILKADNPRSSVSKMKTPETCGRCHVQIYALYQRSVHGHALLAEGNLDAPSCTNCHGEHDILPPKESGSEVSVTNIPETCSHCHSSMVFNDKYGITGNPTKSFKRSFHGIANELGSKKVAECASCHTAHDVLPPEDARSSVHPVNIPRTCGQADCHPGANANFARGRFHVDPEDKESGIIYWVALFFKWLTIGTLVFLVLHILLDLQRKLRHKHSEGV